MSFIVDFFKAVAGICRTKPLSPEYWHVEGNRVTIQAGGVAELQAAGSAVYLTGNGLKRPILVVRDAEGDYHGFSNRCTHAGRKLDPVEGKPVLRCCSVSHSTYDYEGNNLTGPGRKPLLVYRTELQDGSLVVII